MFHLVSILTLSRREDILAPANSRRARPAAILKNDFFYFLGCYSERINIAVTYYEKMWTKIWIFWKSKKKKPVATIAAAASDTVATAAALTFTAVLSLQQQLKDWSSWCTSFQSISCSGFKTLQRPLWIERAAATNASAIAAATPAAAV